MSELTYEEAELAAEDVMNMSTSQVIKGKRAELIARRDALSNLNAAASKIVQELEPKIRTLPISEDTADTRIRWATLTNVVLTTNELSWAIARELKRRGHV